MQFLRRNVDFSNLGLIGRHREEKLDQLLSQPASGQRFWVRLLAL
jgi:hypothetical protein